MSKRYHGYLEPGGTPYVRVEGETLRNEDHEDVELAPQGLAMYVFYGPTHDWSTETGLRQLALDIMIDYFGETPNVIELRRREHDVAAWMPHLAYFSQLSPLVRSEQWVITHSQVHEWVGDWISDEHTRRALSRYEGVYTPMPYALWSDLLDTLIVEQHILELRVELATHAYRVKTYIAGYHPWDLVLRWVREHLTAVEHPRRPAAIEDETPF